MFMLRKHDFSSKLTAETGLQGVSSNLNLNFISLALMVWALGSFEDLEEQDESVYQSINYKGVCGTALATPGLLNTWHK